MVVTLGQQYNIGEKPAVILYTCTLIAMQGPTKKNQRPSSFRLPLTSLCDVPLLFVYFQVNNGVLHFLDYAEDIYIMVLSVLVSM